MMLFSKIAFSSVGSSAKENLGSKSISMNMPSGGFRNNKEHQPPVESSQWATYLLPGSALVRVSGSSRPRTIASLQPDEKILGMELVAGSSLVWTTLQHIELDSTSTPKTMMVGLGEADNFLLRAEQVILAKDRKKRLMMQSVRRLDIGVDSVIAFNSGDLRWLEKKSSRAKKIRSLEIVSCTEGLYKLTLGSTEHSLLISHSLDANCFVVANPTNSTLDSKALADCGRSDATYEFPKMEVQVKNTFVQYEEEKEGGDAFGGRPRSFSDSDIHALALELELDCPHALQKPFSINDHAVDAVSSVTFHSKVTEQSKESSRDRKSVV